MLIPHFMHEFELLVLKGFFIHLLRILYAHGGGAIATLNKRLAFTKLFIHEHALSQTEDFV
jgi:hypothetical protein